MDNPAGNTHRNKNYIRGYNMERYCCLTLEFNGYHVLRKYKSIGVEDIIGFAPTIPTVLVQVKSGKARMSFDEQIILKKHAQSFGAIPIYLFQDGKEKIWVNLLTNDTFDMYKFSKEWYLERNKTKKMLKIMKKKSLGDYNKYVLANWKRVHPYIC